MEVVEAVDIFLDLAIESREVILSLGVLNADVESSLDSVVTHSRERKLNGQGKEVVAVFVVWWTRGRCSRCFVELSMHEIVLM